MGIIVDLYIKSNRVDNIRPPILGQGEHLNSIGEDVWIIDGTTIFPNEKDVEVKEMLETLREKYELKIKVHDISLRSERRKAYFKKIKQTPMIVIGGQRIEGIPKIDELEKIFDSINGPG
ncbi:MAG: hypothetical protein KAS67_01575 [Thermoplasmata archaeon]|nr:hypothetical protein [Thermoplasmata archaeon]